MSETDFDAIKNLEKLFKQKTLLDVAVEIEKFLDFMNVYVYPNWFEGELVDGPNVGRYWVTITLRYPYKKMPDPMAARIMHDVGVIVNYKKDIMMEPIKIKKPEDFRPNSKKPKLLPKHIWHVELKIPRKFIDDIDYNDLEDIDDDIDVEDAEDAADQGANDQDNIEKMNAGPEQDEHNEMAPLEGGAPGEIPSA